MAPARRTDVTDGELLALRRAGWTDSEIAKRYGMSRTRLWQRLGPRHRDKQVIHHIGPRRDKWDEIIRRASDGESKKKIARDLGVSRSMVFRVLRVTRS